MTAETIARVLGGRKAGAAWMARCPAHYDRAPSLAIFDASDGKVLVRCHAGCDQCDVIAALRARGLWDPGAREESKDARSPRSFDKQTAKNRRACAAGAISLPVRAREPDHFGIEGLRSINDSSSQPNSQRPAERLPEGSGKTSLTST